MSALIDRFVVWGQQLVETLGYLGLAVIMLLENAFPPVPSEPFLLGAGFTSGRGGMSMPLAIVAATVGATLGTTFYYWLGLALPEARIRRLLRSYGRFALLGEDDLDRALAWFRRHGRPVIFFGRCIPLVRALISVPAGMTRMPFGQFLLYTVTGSAVWSALLIVTGRVLGENYEAALTLLDRYEQAFIAVVVLSVVAFVVLRLRARRRQKAHPEQKAHSDRHDQGAGEGPGGQHPPASYDRAAYTRPPLRSPRGPNPNGGAPHAADPYGRARHQRDTGPSSSDPYGRGRYGMEADSGDPFGGDRYGQAPFDRDPFSRSPRGGDRDGGDLDDWGGPHGRFPN